MANTNLPQDWAEVPVDRQAPNAPAGTGNAENRAAADAADEEVISDYVAGCDFVVRLSDADRAAMPLGAFIPFRDKNLLTFGITTYEVGAKQFIAIAKELRLAAVAISYLAMLRGENENDPTSTFGAALYGSVFLQHWAEAFDEIARSGLYGEVR